ncbi:MAG: hypothetical protein DI636_07250 [Pelagerythrobacter marensis]|uniref:hypothetical protein n=1 Tax=Qipengyuania sp. YIM B01966 TaxID=2778646 RepID=UPI000DB66205|nr:hypothetical protein [Qipengyuania sp. YIM B01966]PZO69523.1 MAG: hypothetical protein DI636_07250 [Pelagerythrobacter marensis]PZU15717.1 MAG: hypothetical protein DI591_09195 [Citromicrobium sp.]
MEGVMALSIPILALMIPFFAIWTKHKERIAKATVNVTAEQTAERAAQYASQITALEDRVRVLERIVTDKGYDVATQIEALRDQRRVDDNAGVALDFASKERV